MEVGSSAPSAVPTSNTNNPRRRRPGNRNRNPRPNPPTEQENTAAPVPPPALAVTPASAPTRGGNPSLFRGRGGRGRGNRGQRGGHRGAEGRTVHGGRQFGGQLTEDTEQPDPAAPAVSASGRRNGRQRPAPALQPDAPEFQPGQLIATNQNQNPRQRQRRPSKSTAPDIATRTHEDINNGHYECAICTEEVRKTSRAWSCRTCWTVFHLGCVKKWSTNEGSAAARQQASDGEMPTPRQWRCPGCNLPKDVLPTSFSCWCEKEMDPKPLSGLPPFSCGQTCSRPRLIPKKCPHPCPSTCHAGPCPPCSNMGPTQSCFCGKKFITRRCADTDYEHGWSCGQVCGELMPCGEHNCPLPCHEGLCGACEVRVPARCYCGQISKDILCCDRGDEKESSQCHLAADGSIAVEHWVGLFECPNVCGREFDCGKHRCEKYCHKQDAESPHCPRSPDMVSRCPCGKTPLSEISDTIRQSCEDPIPNCAKPCGKLLGCGHGCQQACHQGDCPPCLQTVSISCRCGRTISSSVCHQGTEEPPQCRRICRVSLNCGRHECGDHCCPGERKASERQSSRRKPRPLNSAPRHPDDQFEAEHICTRSCGRQLKCGNPDHQCQELCHKGACGTCREAIFEEISCNCGRTILQPPSPCGTKPPPCRFSCDRRKTCGHPQVAHNCHQDDESCPKCPFLTTKDCLCGKKTLSNQPCWLNDVRCGEVCGRKLRCGAHKCQKQCHRPGECEEPCKQPCGKELSICGHPCMAPCHSPIPCKEDRPCSHKIFITCDCQRIKQEAKCNASKTNDGNHKKVLKCDEECGRLERNRKLALALSIDPATHQDDHIPYQAATLNMYQENSTWAATQEKEFRLFAADSAQKRLRFKPMARHQRAFLHSIAEDFGLDSESMDPEPHRHVAIFKTPRFVMAPMKTLAECARIRQVQRVSNVSAPSAAATTVLRSKPANSAGDPFNSFLITNPRFGLTIADVSAVVKTINPPFPLEVNFLPSEEVALRPPLMARANMTERDMQDALEKIKPALSHVIAVHSIGKLQLARLDSSLNILRKESDVGPGSGWSQVAAKGAPMRKVEKAAPLGTRGGFAVLSLSTARKKKEKMVEVADDWEAAEMMEEEKERASGIESGVNSGDEGRASSLEGGRPDSQMLGVGGSGDGLDGVAVDGAPDEFKATSGGGRWADMDDD